MFTKRALLAGMAATGFGLAALDRRRPKPILRAR